MIKLFRQPKFQAAVIVVICFLAYIVVLQFNVDYTNLVKFLDEGTLRLIVIMLVSIVAVQSVGFYQLWSRQSRVAIQKDGETEEESRGRGRPRKPCQLALAGILSCPLFPDLEVDPEYVERMSQAVIKNFQRKITAPETKGKPEDAKPMPEKTEQSSEVHEPEMSTSEPKKELNKSTENLEVGKLMLEILDRKETLKEKKEKEIKS